MEAAGAERWEDPWRVRRHPARREAGVATRTFFSQTCAGLADHAGEEVYVELVDADAASGLAGAVYTRGA